MDRRAFVAGMAALPFFMYPHAEVAGRPRRGERAETFRYTITAHPVPVP